MASRVSIVASVVESGYETNRLAIALFQDQTNLWSVGLVAVVRGSFGAVIDTAVCYLIPPNQSASGGGGGASGVSPSFCANAAESRQQGQNYTIIWLASSDAMCATFESQLTCGGIHGGQLAATTIGAVNVRCGPGTNYPIAFQHVNGAQGTVACYRDGQTMTNPATRISSSHWDMTTIDGVTGYIADVFVDTNGDITKQTHPC